MESKEVPYIVYESAEARHERTFKRLLCAVVISALLVAVTNGLWIYFTVIR